MILGAILVAASPLGTATETSKMVGSFGFNWLRPKTAQCQLISEPLAKRFRRCERQAGAFGLSDPLYACRIDDRTEYVVFATSLVCSENLEAMRANAP